MPGNRPTDAALVLRIEQIVNLLLSGLRRSEIIRFVAEKTDWGVVDRTIDNYIGRATKNIRAAHEGVSEHNMAMAQMRLLDLYKRSMNIQDYKTCLSILREIAKLNALYPLTEGPLSVELTGKDGGPLTFAEWFRHESEKQQNGEGGGNGASVATAGNGKP